MPKCKDGVCYSRDGKFTTYIEAEVRSCLHQV